MQSLPPKARAVAALALCAAAACAAAGCSERDIPSAPKAAVALALEPVLGGLDNPVFVGHAGDGTGVLYVVEQTGVVKRWDRASGESPSVFLDLRGHVRYGGEQGVLGLAFPPDFEASRQFYVHYSGKGAGETVVSRFALDALDPKVADPASEQILLSVDQPYPNHNGGMLAFGPDGMLFIGLGDGGSAGDPHGNGQDLGTLLGKVLRIDVSRLSLDEQARPRPYAIPPDNPFAGDEERRGEIWAYGLRNPWRFSFDRATGDLWVGDVGQARYEEIDLIPAGSGGGQNFGWNVFEGSTRYRSGDAPGHVKPVAEYDHDDGCSVTGGYVYRGTALPSLVGDYLFGDYCSGNIWVLSKQGDGWSASIALETGLNVSSFGEAEDGEVFVVDLKGSIHALLPAASGG